MKSLIVLAAFFATSLAIACPSDRICSGDRIIDSAENVGTVKEVFNNGQVLVSLDKFIGTQPREINTIGKGVGCFQHICVGDRIIDSAENVGTVKEVFDNGQARVGLDKFVGTHVRQIKALGKGFRCIGHACVNDRVMDSAQNTGKILEVFDNGQALVSLDKFLGTHVRSFLSLGIQMSCDLREN